MTNCEIIRDLLPLYHDGACSPASRALVEEHVAACGECRDILEGMSEPLPPPVNSFLPSPSRLKQARDQLVRKTALAVTAVFCALGVFIASGVSLYTAFEKERVIPWTDWDARSTERMLSGWGLWGEEEGPYERISLFFRPERYVRASCLFRRVAIDGEERDAAILQFTQSWARKVLDTGLEGPEEVRMGVGTGLYIGRGGQKHDVAYGPEYEPEYWNPFWEYGGALSAVYYLESPSPIDLKDAPEGEVLAALERHGVLIWKDGKAIW